MKFSPLSILSLLVVFSIASCSKMEEPIGDPAGSLTIILKSDAGTSDNRIIGVGTTVDFTVTGSDGIDYTNDSKYFLDDQEIEGPSYYFTVPGEYDLYAQYDGIISNSIHFQVLEPDQRALSVDHVKALRNQTITFTLTNDQGVDVSEDAVFYVDGESISGNTYSSATEGAHQVRADYEIEGETYSSATKNFEVYIPKRKVVIEDYTGTWCGFCPAVAVAIDSVRTLTPHVAVVAIHKTSSTIPDPMDFPRVQELQAMFDVDNGFPKARINRTVSWPDPYEVSQVTNMAGKNTDVSIAISSKVNGSNLSVKVKTVYENGSSPGDKLVVYLVENKIISPQANYFDRTPGHKYNGRGNPILDYEHNDALRNSLSDLFGDAIPTTVAFEEYTKEYNFTIPSHYVIDNLSFVVMVVDSGNTAKNTQFADIREEKLFE